MLIPRNQPEKRAKKNPLDARMTKTQVVRRKFKSALPRRIKNRALSKMEALARSVELFDQLRNMMAEAGLSSNNAYAALVYYQPETKGQAHVHARILPLPETAKPKEIGGFAEEVLKLDKPLFLGVLFSQHDPDADKAEYQNVIFAWPFLLGSEVEGRLIGARDLMAKGGSKKIAN